MGQNARTAGLSLPVYAARRITPGLVSLQIRAGLMHGSELYRTRLVLFYEHNGVVIFAIGVIVMALAENARA